MQQNKSNWISKGILLSAALILMVAMFSGCAKKGATAAQSKNVATYKGGEITQAEFDKFVGVNKTLDSQLASALDAPESKDVVLNQLVNQAAVLEILYSKTNDNDKKAGEKKAADYLAPIKSWDATQKKSFDDSLKKNNVTQADVEDYFKHTFSVMASMDAQITDQQVTDEYNSKLKADPKAYEISTVRHILIALKDPSDQTGQKDLRTKDEALARAKEVKAQLDKGGDFDALAKQYSDDPGSKDNGGKYENINLATSGFDPDFVKAADSLEVNKVSDPVETSFGYHIMRVDSRKTQTLDEKKDEIRNTLASGKIDEFMQKDMPSYDFKSLLPQPSPSPAASAAPGSTPAASGAPAASPGASAAPASPATSPAASPAASASASPAAK